jgi:trehalose synthase
VGDALLDELTLLADRLSGLRICHINSTSAGGGVAELLHRQIPLLQALGLKAEWRLMVGSPAFFAVTKDIHNALQGDKVDLTKGAQRIYLEHNQKTAELLDQGYDIYIVHDPQPAALRHFAGRRNAQWIWRCHIDTADPAPSVWSFLRPFVQEHDAGVFTLEQFVPPDLQIGGLALIPPAIDPLATKNIELPMEICRQVVANAGLDLGRPILLQVSRFDPWKDPLGVIEAYHRVKRRKPEVQLALLGVLAGDDPQGWSILESVRREAERDDDLYVFTNLIGAGNLEVNAFQRVADVVIQKSIKEAFGLVVSEALWKEAPMVAGRTGGIPMQFPDEYRGYLVDSVETCADGILDLLEHPEICARFGAAGQERVRQRFLLPRLVRDELALIESVMAVSHRNTLAARRRTYA